ncbi:MAG: hypothetical protein JST76_14610 [Bacteroidetes bacterium]|nr:hypothetical protein [Bacteroidota bacterium]
MNILANTFLDIAFQFGNFYGQPDSGWLFTLFNTILGAFIGSGASIYVFYKTISYDKKKEEYKERKFQKDKVKYFQSLIRNINTGLNTQIAALKTFAETVRENPTDLPLLNAVPLFDLTRVVHKVNQEEYYHSFIAEFGNSPTVIDDYRTIILLLDYFEANISMIKESLQRSIQFDYERKVQYKRMIEKAMDETAGALINQEVQNEHAFWNFLNDSIITFHEENDEHSDIKFYHEHFVIVIKQGLMPFATRIPLAHYLLVQMKNATQFYTNIQLQNLNVASDFDEWNSTLSAKYRELQEATQKVIEHIVSDDIKPEKNWLISILRRSEE